MGNAEVMVSNLRKLLPKIEGPKVITRTSLISVATSKILYAVQVWGIVCKYRTYVHMIQRMLRRLAIGVRQCYRTVSHDVTMLLARMLPAKLMIEERILVLGKM